MMKSTADNNRYESMMNTASMLAHDQSAAGSTCICEKVVIPHYIVSSHYIPFSVQGVQATPGTCQGVAIGQKF